MEEILDRLVAHSFTLARLSGWICGLLLTVSAFLIGLDIALREIFVVTLGGANELSGYALAVSSSWGCTVALVHRMHVRIDSVYTHLSARIRALLDMIGLAGFIYFLTFVTYYAYKVLEQSIESNTHSISAVTGTAVGNVAGWTEVTKYLMPIALGWAINVHVVNLNTWKKLDPKVQAFFGAEYKKFEDKFWQTMKELDADAANCNVGKQPCQNGKLASMIIVPVSDADQVRFKKLIQESVLKG